MKRRFLYPFLNSRIHSLYLIYTRVSPCLMRRFQE